MKKWLKIILPVLIISASLSVVWNLYQHRPQQAQVAARQNIWQVNAYIITRESLQSYITLYAKLESPDTYQAAAPAFGRIKTILIREGLYVHQGDLLAVMDEDDFLPKINVLKARLAAINAQIEKAYISNKADKRSLAQQKTLLTLSKNALRRASNIQKKQLASVAETEQAQKLVLQQQLSINALRFKLDAFALQIKELNANKQQAENDLRQAQIAYQRSRFIAPFNGIISKVNVASGDQVNTGSPIFRLYRPDTLEYRATIPFFLQPRIRQSLVQQQSLYAYLDSGQKLRLRRLAGLASPSGIDAFFSYDNTSKNNPMVSEHPGSLHHLRLMLSLQKPVFKIPYSAIYGKDTVYQLTKPVPTLADEEYILQSVKVRIVGDYFQPDVAAIDKPQEAMVLFDSDDLSDGAQILITHLPDAINGMRVKLLQ